MIYWLVVGLCVACLVAGWFLTPRGEHRDEIERDRWRHGGGHLR